MSEPKFFASLSPSLLARKGQARPAMRPQLITTTSTLEDLGWNDMGFEPAPATEKAPRTDHGISSEEVKANPVGRAQNSIVEAFAAKPTGTAMKPRSAVPPQMAKAPTIRAAPGAKGKTAFTLRLDSDRHLKLRLASAVTHRSAQQIVTEALDLLLDTMPEVDMPGWNGKTRN